MAKKTNTVDYFPHYISDGKKMFTLEQLFGNDGYASFFKLLEILARSENHFLDLNDVSNLLYLRARFGADKAREGADGGGSAEYRDLAPKTMQILQTFASLGMINKQAFEEKIIYSDSFIESLSEVYRKRTAKPLSLKIIISSFGSNRGTLEGDYPRPSDAERRGKAREGGKNTQSKVKESKVEKSREKESIDSADDFLQKSTAGEENSKSSLFPELIKEKSSAKKEKKENLHHSCRTIFEEFYAEKKSEKFYYNPKEAGSLKNLLNALKFKMTERQGREDFTHDEMTNSFRYFLNAAYVSSDQFLKGNFTISMLYTKFNEIFSKINSKSNGSTTSYKSDRDTRISELEEFERRNQQIIDDAFKQADSRGEVG